MQQNKTIKTPKNLTARLFALLVLLMTWIAQPQPSFATFAPVPGPVITGATIPCGTSELVVSGEGFDGQPEVALDLGVGRLERRVPTKLAEAKPTMLTLEASDLAEGAGHLTVINADGNAHSVNVDVTWDSCATIGDSTDGAPISGSYRITVR